MISTDKRNHLGYICIDCNTKCPLCKKIFLRKLVLVSTDERNHLGYICIDCNPIFLLKEFKIYKINEEKDSTYKERSKWKETKKKETVIEIIPEENSKIIYQCPKCKIKKEIESEGEDYFCKNCFDIKFEHNRMIKVD